MGPHTTGVMTGKPTAVVALLCSTIALPGAESGQQLPPSPWYETPGKLSVVAHRADRSDFIGRPRTLLIDYEGDPGPFDQTHVHRLDYEAMLG